MHKLSFLSILAIISLVSCHKTSEIPVYKVDADRALPYTSADQIIKKQSVVPIDTSLLLDAVLKATVLEQGFIIQDVAQARVYLLDRQGNYLCDISRQGQGPGEYSSLGNISYDPDNKRIDLMNASKNQMLHFALDGSYLGTTEGEGDYKPWYSIFIPEGDGYWFNNSYEQAPDEDKFCLLRTDKQFRITERYLPYDEGHNMRINGRNVFWRMGNQIRYVPNYSQTVYSITSGKEPQPCFSVDFGRHNLDVESFKEKLKRGIIDYQDLEGNASVTIPDFYETRSQITISYYYKGNLYWTGIDKRSGDSVSLCMPALDRDGLTSILIQCTADDQFVCIDSTDQEQPKIVFFTWMF